MRFGVNVGKSAVGVYYQRHIVPADDDDLAEAAGVLAKLKEKAASCRVPQPRPNTRLVRARPSDTRGDRRHQSAQTPSLRRAAEDRPPAPRARPAPYRPPPGRARCPRPAPARHRNPRSFGKIGENPPLFPGYSINVHPQTEAQRHASRQLLSSSTGRLTHTATISTPDQSGVTLLATASPLAV